MVSLNLTMQASHVCKMPRRRSKWRNRIYVCKCGVGWISKYHSSDDGTSEAPLPGYYLWYPVELTIGREPVYNHG